MKTHPVTILTDISVKENASVDNPFTWAKVHARMLRIRRRLPEPWNEILPVETVNDTKITCRLLLAVSVLLLGLGLCATPILIVLYVRSLYHSKKGGHR